MIEMEFNSTRCYFVQLLVEHRHKFLFSYPISGQMTCVHLHLSQYCPDRMQCLKGLEERGESHLLFSNLF